MGRFSGLKGLILGVANDHSIAWAIAKEILTEGGEIGFSHLPDRPDDERQRNRRRVAQLTDSAPNAKFLVPMDAGTRPWTTSRARPPTAVGRVFGLQWKPVLIACSL